MKKFEHLTPKELKLWEDYIQNEIKVTCPIPTKLLKSCWVDRYNKSGHIYDPVFNTRPDKTIREPVPKEQHRTYKEDITKEYQECS